MPFDALEPFDISPEIQCQELYLGRLRAHPQVAVLLINRPTKGNAFTESMFNKFKQLIEYLEDSLDSLDIRVCVVYSRGKLFSAGIDIGTLNQIYKRFLSSECPGEAREKFRRGILRMQDSFTSMERLRCPVISCIQGPCIGGGVDLITAADIRVCNEAATFCVKEVDVGIVADLGTLARLPSIVGQGNATELCLTARTIHADEALRIGLVSKVVPGRDAESLLLEAISLAASLALKPKLALFGTKRSLVRSKACQVAEDLDAVATWNSAQMISKNLEHVIQRISKL